MIIASLLLVSFCMTQSLFAVSVHGHAGVVEKPSRVQSLEYKGVGMIILNKINQSNWVHYSIETDGEKFDYVLVKLKVEQNTCPHVKVNSVHIWDGKKRVGKFTVNWVGSGYIKVNFPSSLKNHKFVDGMGVSIGIAASGCGDVFRKLTFYSVTANEI